MCSKNYTESEPLRTKIASFGISETAIDSGIVCYEDSFIHKNRQVNRSSTRNLLYVLFYRFPTNGSCLSYAAALFTCAALHRYGILRGRRPGDGDREAPQSPFPRIRGYSRTHARVLAPSQPVPIALPPFLAVPGRLTNLTLAALCARPGQCTGRKRRQLKAESRAGRVGGRC